MTPVLIPYVEVDGAYSLTDTQAGRIWDEMAREGLDKVTFYSGDVRDKGQFLEMMKRRANVVHTIWDKDTERPLMVAWLNAWQKNAALAHFCILPDGWGKHSVRLGRMSLGHWFSFENGNGPLLDVIVGKTPASNRAATIYLRRVGMTVLGEIPHLEHDYYIDRTVGCVFSYVTREGFDNGQR